MYNLTKLKILVIGPEASGKTAVVNYLSQKANVLEAPYRPTNSVRIVEHETEVDNRLVSIEFWDVSGKDAAIEATLKTIGCGQG
jgi:GTPase SAR1 family protein